MFEADGPVWSSMKRQDKILAPLELQLQQHKAVRYWPKPIAIQQPRRTAFEIRSQSRQNPL
jgi:hypothetical protein